MIPTQNPMIQNPILAIRTSCKACAINNSHTNPVINYQNQQRIWNSVRIDCAQYAMNKAALTTYEPFLWNQQSDRTFPHVQIATVPSHGNSTKRTITRARPGAGTPGGIGCDIKFNSYARYLNRLKGKSALRRGYISPEITKAIASGVTIPFNPAFPMYGGKYYKTNIISSCKCPGSDLVSAPNEIVSSFESRVFNVGQIIMWEECKYATIIDFLANGYALIQYLDKYGDEKNMDIVNLSLLPNLKKIDSSFFEIKDILITAQDYFENSLNSVGSICSP
jgi:hypothetical protein